MHKNENDIKQAEAVLRKVVVTNEFMQMLGIELLELKVGYGKGRMKYKRELANPYGMFHGGSLYSLADTIAGSAACMNGYYVTTVSGNMNYMRPGIDTEYVYCEAKALKEGNHLSVFEIKITDDKGMLLDSGEFTFFATRHEVQ